MSLFTGNQLLKHYRNGREWKSYNVEAPDNNQNKGYMTLLSNPTYFQDDEAFNYSRIIKKRNMYRNNVIHVYLLKNTTTSTHLLSFQAQLIDIIGNYLNYYPTPYQSDVNCGYGWSGTPVTSEDEVENDSMDVDVYFES